MARPRRTEPAADDDEDEARRNRWRAWFVAVRKASGAPGGDALYAAMESVGDGETADEVLVRFGLLDTFENFYRVKTGACEVSRQLCEGSLSGPLDYGRPIPRPRPPEALSEALSVAQCEPVGPPGVDRGAEADQGEVVALGALDVEIDQVEQEQKRRLVVAEAEPMPEPSGGSPEGNGHRGRRALPARSFFPTIPLAGTDHPPAQRNGGTRT